MKIVFESAFIVSKLKWDEIVGYFWVFLLTITILYEVQSLKGEIVTQRSRNSRVLFIKDNCPSK